MAGRARASRWCRGPASTRWRPSRSTTGAATARTRCSTCTTTAGCRTSRPRSTSCAAELPAVESVSLVVSWFGDDLRCDRCTLRPAVEQTVEDGDPMPWRVSGQGRSGAKVVSRIEGRPVFGGTPCDALGAAGDRPAEGARPVGDVLSVHPDGHPGGERARAIPGPATATSRAVPWRGRITLDRAPGRAGSTDKTAAAAAEVDAFFGAAQPSDFDVDGDGGRLPRAGGVVVSALHPALCASLRAGGRGRGVLHRLGDALADAGARRGAELSGGAGAAAAGRGRARDPRAGREDRLCGRLVGVLRAPAGRRVGRRDLPPRSAVGASRHRLRRHRQLHAAVGLARRAEPRRRGGRVDLRSRLSEAATSPAARASTGTMPTRPGATPRTGCRSATAPTASPGCSATRTW